jgi:hypothetical protein
MRNDITEFKELKNDLKDDLETLGYNDIKNLKASVGGFFGGYYSVDINFVKRKLKWRLQGAGKDNYYEKQIQRETLDMLREGLISVDILNWNSEYIDSDILDGTQWDVTITTTEKNIEVVGSNKYPEKWTKFCKLIREVSGKKFQ